MFSNKSQSVQVNSSNLHTYTDYARNRNEADIEWSEHSQDWPKQIGLLASGFASFHMPIPVDLEFFTKERRVASFGRSVESVKSLVGHSRDTKFDSQNLIQKILPVQIFRLQITATIQVLQQKSPDPQVSVFTEPGGFMVETTNYVSPIIIV